MLKLRIKERKCKMFLYAQLVHSKASRLKFKEKVKVNIVQK